MSILKKPLWRCQKRLFWLSAFSYLDIALATKHTKWVIPEIEIEQQLVLFPSNRGHSNKLFYIICLLQLTYSMTEQIFAPAVWTRLHYFVKCRNFRSLEKTHVKRKTYKLSMRQTNTKVLNTIRVSERIFCRFMPLQAYCWTTRQK